MGESAVDEIAAPIYSRYSDIATSILFNKSEVEIHLAARSETAEAAAIRAAELADELAAALGKAVFSTDGESMEMVVGRLLTERRDGLDRRKLHRWARCQAADRGARFESVFRRRCRNLC